MDNSGIEAIYNMQKLERLFIRVSLPNGDDIAEEEDEWRMRLHEQHVVRISEDLKSHRNGHIVPNKITQALMRLAQSNGFIIAHGLQDGEKVTRKSSEFPVDFQDKYSEESSILERLIRNGIAKLHIFTNRKEK